MEWIRGQTIGHGSSASISIAVSHRSGVVFAVKSAEFSQYEFLQMEQKIMSTLISPHIVAYKGYDITKANNKLVFNILMEYVPGGTLIDAIHKHGGQLDESMISYYTRQIVLGLDYLHSRDIVHCDVKGRNILLAESGVKICDFGCSKRLNSEDQQVGTSPIGGTPMFMAPEVARGDEQGFPADIWALGCTIIEMATGGSPWPNVTTPESVMYKIAFSGEVPNFPDSLSDQAKDFLSKCLRRDSKERWTAKQLLKHPFIEQFKSIAKHNQELDPSSPPSILDQGIWNSFEELESCCEMIQPSVSDSPFERMKKLSLNSGKAGWRWDETWTTIRSCIDQSDREEDMVVCGTISACSSDHMEMKSRRSTDNLINSILDNVRGIDTSMSDTSIERRSVVNNFHFDIYKQKSVINQYQYS